MVLGFGFLTCMAALVSRNRSFKGEEEEERVAGPEAGTGTPGRFPLAMLTCRLAPLTCTRTSRVLLGLRVWGVMHVVRAFRVYGLRFIRFMV